MISGRLKVMMAKTSEASGDRPHLLRLLFFLLVLLLSAAVLVGAGSYALLRAHAIDSARAEAEQRLDEVFAKIADITPNPSRIIPFFFMLRGQVTATASDAQDERVTRYGTASVSSPSTLLAFDPGDGTPLIFDPRTIVDEVIDLGEGKVRIHRTVTLMTGESSRQIHEVYYGMQRSWPNSSARLIMASKITPVDRSIGQIAAFTVGVLILFMVSVSLVFWLAQRNFNQQMREIRKASDKIARSDDIKERLPVLENSELGRLSGHINGMIEKIQARGRLLRQQSFALDHDYREPIARVIAHARQAIRTSDGENSQLVLLGAMSEIHDVAQQMDLAARERLEIYKFDLAVTEGETDTMEELDLTILAEEALESCWMLTESQGVETRLEASEPVKILGSWSLLTRALANLVRNSVSLSRPGDRVDVRILCLEGFAQIHVVDHAGGLPEVVLHAINDTSQSGEMIRSARSDGVGLGLQIARYVMLAHRGRLEAENTADGAILKLILKPGL